MQTSDPVELAVTTYIPIYIQEDATLHSLFYLETALHVSGVVSTHHQERKKLRLQHLVFVTPLLLPATSGGR
jgi:bifunctional DNase/RNase